VGFPGSVWVRATDAAGQPLESVTLAVEPEPGLEVTNARATTCASGWAEILVTPTFHTAGVSIHARAEGADGLWYGAVPVIGGGSFVALPSRLEPNTLRTVDVHGAKTRGPIYVELDDGHGRIRAEVLESPRGAFEIPPLAAGTYWLVTSSEPSGAEALAGGAGAVPFVVEPPGRPSCDIGAALALATPAGFPRTIGLDGFAAQRGHARKRQRLGATIGVSALAIGAMLETLLLLRAAKQGAALSPRLTKRAPAMSLAMALLAALLGFALLAALVLYRG
jgi:hypothetical protein